MSDGNDIIYWWDGAHWTHGAAPVPDAPGPPVPGAVWFCGPNAMLMTTAGTLGQVLVSGGEDAPYWADIDPPWETPTLLNGWTNFGLGYAPAGFRRHLDGTGELRGYLSGGLLGVPMFVVPYKPALQVPRLVLAGMGSARVDVSRLGSVIAQRFQGGGGPTVSLTGYRYPLA